MIIQTAPVIIVKRFTTFVMATRPTFCENEVTGGHPNNPEILDAYPSHAREPEISLLVILRSSPEDTRKVVSPMVSAADTRKIIQVETIAPAWNSGFTGRRCGREKIPPDKIMLRSTFPIKMAIT